MADPVDKRAVKVSRFLARHLRHAPQDIGVTLDRAGWASVDKLLAGARRAGFAISRDELDAAVDAPGKRRYTYDAHRRRIRAVQGHSVGVELGYAPAVPPAMLYHGTHRSAVGDILSQGLRPMRRDHVHLSADVDTARVVGARRGRPVVLPVDAAAAHADGQVFLRADNGVWLTDALAADYLGAPIWA